MSEFWLVAARTGSFTICEMKPDAMRQWERYGGGFSGATVTHFHMGIATEATPTQDGHFVDGIPRDVTPGREKAEPTKYEDLDLGGAIDEVFCIREELSARLAKIEKENQYLRNDLIEMGERVDRIEEEAGHFNCRIAELKERLDALESKPDHVADASKMVDLSTDCGKVERPADASKTISGAEAVRRALVNNSNAPAREWTGVGYVTDGQLHAAYDAAVAHHRKTHPHMTLAEIRTAFGISFTEMQTAYDRIEASRKEAE